jgi:aspartate/methionine/tyrosine aminotransferase
VKLEPFLLDHWLDKKTGEKRIEFNLATSTGPRWTTWDLLQLLDTEGQQRLLDTEMVYSPATGARELRQAIAEMEGVEADEVQVVTGASEALLILFLLSAQPGSNVILPSPCFPTIEALPASFGTQQRSYRLRREQGFRADLGEIKGLADSRTALLLVNSPHNPTGATLTDEELCALQKFAAERQIQFVCDEVYHPIYHGRETRSASRLSHATVISGLSKALSLSGLRIGWIIEHDPQRRKEYLNARQYFTISNSPLNEALATIAVRHRDIIWKRAAEVAHANLVLLDRFFAEFADIFGWIRPSGGVTAFPWLNSGGNSRSLCENLSKRGILLVPGDCFNMASHFRLGFGALDPDDCRRALETFADYLHDNPA